MSELINNYDKAATIRGKLLTGASALVLTACISFPGAVSAADAGKPMIWFEAGGQFDLLADDQSKWVPDFVSEPFAGPLAGQFTGIQRQPRHGYDANAAIIFQPAGSDWSISASVQIGKARQPDAIMKTEHMSAYHRIGHGRGGYVTLYNGTAHNNESHIIVDFQVGKDVGLGFGANGNSTLHAGVRIAQIRSRADVHINTESPLSYYGTFHNQVDTGISRKFEGVGPSIAWDGTVPMAGTVQDGELAFDWAANAALLFGRQTVKQKTHGLYQSNYYDWAHFRYVGNSRTASPTHFRRKNVTVPNLGGSIGISYRWSAAKVSLGYRADWYFNALDGGVATSEKVNRGFFGPYARVSIGVGD